VFERVETNDELRITISSELGNVGRVLDAVREWLSDLPPRAYSRLCVVLEELTVNAIVHGNRIRRKRLVSCRLKSFAEECVKVTVEDEGKGFDYCALDMSLPEHVGLSRNRGYALIGALSESLEFNEQGNRVTACLRLSDETVGNSIWAGAHLDELIAERLAESPPSPVEGGNVGT